MPVTAADIELCRGPLAEHPGLVGTDMPVPVYGIVPSARASIAAITKLDGDGNTRRGAGELARRIEDAIRAAAATAYAGAPPGSYAGDANTVGRGLGRRVDHGRGTVTELVVQGPVAGSARVLLEKGLGNASWGGYVVALRVEVRR